MNRDLFDQMSQSVVCYDRAGRILYANPVTAAMFGRPADALVGHVLWELFPEAQGNLFFQVFHRVATTGRAEQFDHHYAPWDRWFANEIYRCQDVVYVIATDITEQKRAEDQRREAERRLARERARLASILDAAPFAVVVYEGPAHVAVFSNPKHDEVTSGRIARGKPLVESLPELAGSPAMRMLTEVFTSCHTRTVPEFHVPLLKDGELQDRWFDVTWQPTHDAAGAVIGVMATAVEVTEHVRARQQADQAQRAAGAAHRLTSAIAANATLGLVVMDSRQHCTFMNPAAERIFGYTLDEVRASNRPLHDIIHHTRPDGRPFPMSECPIDRALPTRMQEQGEDMFVRPDGSFYPVAFTASPMFEEGVASGTIVEVADITERKRYEAQLRRTIAARDEFLSIASHELRTPLTTLGIQLESLAKTVSRLEDPKGQRQVEAALRQAARLTTLVDGLLDVSRIGLGKFRLDLSDFDLGDAVSDVAARFDEEATRHGSPIEVSTTKAQGRWDRSKIDQLLTNLVSNAIKYGARRPISIGMTADRQAVTVVVTDEGIGIPTEAQQRIFERYERAVPTSNFGGLGLGLYIAKQIAEAHGGTIEVHSEPERGSTFTVTLPRQTTPNAADGERHPTGSRRTRAVDRK